MPPIRSLISKYFAYYSKLVAVILLLSKIMPTCSYYIERKGDAQEASKDNSKREKGAKVEHKRMPGNHLPQYNTG